MKKTILTTAAGLSLAVSAFGISYSDADYFGGKTGETPNGQAIAPGGSISSSFDFVPAVADGTSKFTISYTGGSASLNGTYQSALGFTPGLQSVVPDSGAVYFWLRDPNAGSEVVKITIADLTLSSGSFSTSKVLFAGNTGVTIEGAINVNGQIGYKVQALTGGSGNNGFTLDAAYFVFDAQNVPDGGTTAMLLGVAVFGLEGARRRFVRA